MPNNLRKIFLSTGLFLAVFSTYNCREKLPSQLRAGGIHWPGYEPLYLADSLDYLGPGIRMVEYPSASEVLRAYQNGSLDMAMLTLDEVIYLHSAGFSGKIILICDISNGADVLLGGPKVKTVADIKGKRLGVEYTALGAFMLARFLEINKLNPGAIKIVPLEVDSHEQAFIRGEVDALITFDPTRTKLLEHGASLIFDSSMIPNEIIDVLIVRDDLLHKYPETVQKVKESWFNALEYMKRNFPHAARLMYPRLKLTPVELTRTFKLIRLGDPKLNAHLLEGKSPLIYQSIEKVSSVMLKNKIINKGVNPKELYTKMED